MACFPDTFLVTCCITDLWDDNLLGIHLIRKLDLHRSWQVPQPELGLHGMLLWSSLPEAQSPHEHLDFLVTMQFPLLCFYVTVSFTFASTIQHCPYIYTHPSSSTLGIWVCEEMCTLEGWCSALLAPGLICFERLPDLFPRLFWRKVDKWPATSTELLGYVNYLISCYWKRKLRFLIFTWRLILVFLDFLFPALHFSPVINYDLAAITWEPFLFSMRRCHSVQGLC